MKKLANLHKNVFNKSEFNETVDTSFTQLKQEVDESFFDINLATMADFWVLYDKFFYQIPKLGEFNSHEYIGKTSLEYADSEYINDQIQALLDEIAALREENLRIMNDALDIGDSLGTAGFADSVDGESNPLGENTEGS